MNLFNLIHFSYFSSTVPRFVPHIIFIRKQHTYEFFWALNSLMLMEYQMGVWGGRCCPEQFKPKWSLDFCWEKTPPGRLVCWIASRNSQLIKMLKMMKKKRNKCLKCYLPTTPRPALPQFFLCNEDYINCLKFSSCLRNGGTIVI